MQQATKLDDFTLEVTTTPEVTPVVQTYDRGFLEQQKLDIQKSKDDFDSLRDAELAQVQALLDLCDQNNIIVKPEPTPVDIAQPDPLPDDSTN